MQRYGSCECRGAMGGSGDQWEAMGLSMSEQLTA